MERCKTADGAFGCYLEGRNDIETAFDRMEQQSGKCMYGSNGICCRLCSNGPCRITAKSPRGVCGATADAIVTRNFLRAVAAGSACYLHVAEATANRLKSIASGQSPLPLRAPGLIDRIAEMLDIHGADRNEKAVGIADAVLQDLYRQRQDPMQLTAFLAPIRRLQRWQELNLMPGGAKAEVFDALVKTSTNLSTDTVDQLFHALRLGICTGLYGLVMTNLMNDIIMGDPQPGLNRTGFQVADPGYVNIAVSGHSHSVFAGLTALLETEAGQEVGRSVGAKGIRLVGLTCVGQDMQLRAAAVKPGVFSGQAGNNFTQEALLATGAIDMVVSEFNCTFSGIEPIAEKYQVKLVCLDDVSKQPSAELIPDEYGNEIELAITLCRMAAKGFAKRRASVRINLPQHGRDDVLAGLSERSLAGLLGGSLEPLIGLLRDGTIKGVAGILGCSNLAAGGHDVTTVELTRELIRRDILVLSAGCTSGGLSNCGLCSPSAAAEAGPGLRQVCEALNIPPVLNFGPCLAIGRIEAVAAELAAALKVDLPQLPVVISAPQWLEEQALADGCFGLALGLPLHLSQPPPILGSPLVTRILTEDLTGITGGQVIVESDPMVAANKFSELIAERRHGLGLSF